MRHFVSCKRLVVGLVLAGGAILSLASRSIFSSATEPSEFPLTNLKAGEFYAVTVSVNSLARITGVSEIETSIADGRGVVASKVLHPGDLLHHAPSADFGRRRRSAESTRRLQGYSGIR
jgi:ABC-type uncharacterized transport system permease subunit